MTLTAERRFEPREELPSSYAAAGDADAKLYLQFPTEVRLDRRADGVYLHFRRTYLPRPWAYVEYWRDQLLDDDLKKLSEKPVEEMTNDEKVKLVEASASIEILKQIELARRALGALAPTLSQGEREEGAPQLALREVDGNVPQDVWLRARGAAKAVAEGIDWQQVMERIVNVPEERRAAAFEEEAERLLTNTYEALAGELAKAAGWDAAEMERFEAAYARQEKLYDITEQLGGHGFKIRVEMPGEIVAHNGDTEDDGAVEWEFMGDAFRDRPYELMVTAKLGE
jgi:hypothetical protein